jgi:PhnB protein
MSNPVRAIPEGYHTVTPYLTCKNAAAAIDFYKKALGATEVVRMGGGPGGAIMHAEIKIGDSMVFLSDEIPGMSAAPSGSGPNPVQLFLYVQDADTTCNNAVAAGAKVTMPVSLMFWGDRYGKFTDPFGHTWGVSTHVEDVTPEEMQRRGAEWRANMAKAAGKS